MKLDHFLEQDGVRIGENEFVKVYEGRSVRGRTPVKWINSMDEYWGESWKKQ